MQATGSGKRPKHSDAEGSSSSMAAVKVKVYIVYYSMHGQVETLAKEILKGVNSVEGVEGKLWQVPETLPADELARLKALPKSDVPIITPEELYPADGFIFGFPARLGMVAAQFTTFLETTEDVGKQGLLAARPTGIFFSTGTQGSGQETAALTCVTQLTHLGMIYVPIGYTFGSGMFELEEVKGGSPYGTGTYSGDGSKQPTQLELSLAFHQGKYTANFVKQLKEDPNQIPARILDDVW